MPREFDMYVVGLLKVIGGYEIQMGALCSCDGSDFNCVNDYGEYFDYPMTPFRVIPIGGPDAGCS